QIFEDPRHDYTRSLMKAVPIADPRKRKSEKDLNFKPIPSPVHPVGHDPGPSEYREISPGHRVLIGNWGDFERDDDDMDRVEAKLREGTEVAEGGPRQPLHD
ncbi:MAG: hypothetical protein AAFQ06_03280, partial [Pseudomonadota bacterium]